jgi:4-diphosphocytidyl-2C-methyl-D-erythritol kinase
MTRLLAPAKLTLSLEVTGVRADGYHELRSEMVSLTLADELVFTEGGTGLTLVADPGTRAEDMPGAEENLIARALVAVGRQAAAPATPPRCCAGPVAATSTWHWHSDPTSPSAWPEVARWSRGRASA